jgi:hypothetical protein
MPKFLAIPEPVQVVDPDIKGAEPETLPFSKAIYHITKYLAAQQQMDILTVIAVRDRVNALAVGEILELSDEEYQAIVPEFKRPRAMNPVVFGLGGGEPLIRAMVNAKDKRPAVLVETKAAEN